MKIGLIKEGRTLYDKRVAFTPDQCIYIQKQFADVHIVVQPCEWRSYKDEEYLAKGVSMSDNLSDCDILMGVKQVPISQLIPNKKYLFFSHTIKKQAQNRELLKAILDANIQLIDYECLTDEKLNRIIGFGYYAGLVGAYNGIMAYGKKYNLFDLQSAHLCYDKNELKEELKKVRLTNIKIIITGNGRVANGAVELLGIMGIRRVTPYEFTHFSFLEPVYTQLHSHNYNERIDGQAWNTADFYKNPQQYQSTFLEYTKHGDMLIHCSYWHPKAPVLFTKEEMKLPDFRIGVIADVSCDIDGAIPSTVKTTSIEDKFYGYNPSEEATTEPFEKGAITVMAIDNLPCELPRNASEDFGKELIEKVLPSLLIEDKNQLIERASIAKGGKLMPRFDYLADYAKLP